jgi:hypothetical protein
MTNQLINKVSQTGRIERFTALQAGHYWRSLKEIPKEGIEQGEVLLIKSIRWVDEAPHTVILRSHPSKINRSYTIEIKHGDSVTKTSRSYGEHRFLVRDFLDVFEFEPDYEAIRAREVQAIQQRIQDLQQELIANQTNPALLSPVIEEGLREWGAKQENSLSENHLALPSPIQTGLAGAIATVIDAGTVDRLKYLASREHQIATIKANWMRGKTSEITETIKSLMPFFEEQGAAALAQTEDVRNHVSKLMSGIESLDLYIGKDVQVEMLCAGEPAPANEPLTILQRKLLMDEELCLFADLDESFDSRQDALFVDTLKSHPGLVEQIFPTQRCILAMATTRRYIDYGDGWINMARNQANRHVFLLVRDGQNIHRVFSPVESHLGASRLFPSKDEQDALFRGIDGLQVKFEDVAYTDKLAAHDRHALHYKRFLILLAGLDHRLKLFGDFYDEEQSLNFISLPFQEKWFRFIHDEDGEGMLPGEIRPPVQEWIRMKNRYLRSGSRVLCLWESLITAGRAPSAFRVGGADVYQAYRTEQAMNALVARRSGGSVYVEVPVSGFNHEHERRSFSCKVMLQTDGGIRGNRKMALASHDEKITLGYLCLDSVTPDELRWYLHHRGNRRDHLVYIRFFKAALAFVESERAAEQDARNFMRQALLDGKVADPAKADELVDRTVIAWRAANRGKALPCVATQRDNPEWKDLLDQMYFLMNSGPELTLAIERFVGELGYRPLRLILSGNAQLVVYAEPALDERDLRLDGHAWVHKIAMKRGSKIREQSRSWTILPSHAASETTLHEWPEAESWLNRRSLFDSPMAKREAFELVLDATGRLKDFDCPLDDRSFQERFIQAKAVQEELLRKGKYVEHPYMVIPIGVTEYARKPAYLCIGANALAILYKNALDQADKIKVRQLFITQYRNRSAGERFFEGSIRDHEKLQLMVMPINKFDRKSQGIVSANEASILDTLKWESFDQFLQLIVEVVQRHYRLGNQGNSSNCWLSPFLAQKDGCA